MAVSSIVSGTNPTPSGFASRASELILAEWMADDAQSPYAGTSSFLSVQARPSLGQNVLSSLSDPTLCSVSTTVEVMLLAKLIGWASSWTGLCTGNPRRMISCLVRMSR